MKEVRGYKTELDLNNTQRTMCLKHAGCARFAYNWGLARSQEAYRLTGKRPIAIDLHKELNHLKRTAYPWMYECSKCAPPTHKTLVERAALAIWQRVVKLPSLKQEPFSNVACPQMSK